jgi:hypothetical protein
METQGESRGAGKNIGEIHSRLDRMTVSRGSLGDGIAATTGVPYGISLWWFQ